MDRIALPLKFFRQNLPDHLPRLLTRCRNVREIIPFLVRSRANIIQTLKKNLAIRRVGTMHGDRFHGYCET